MYIFFRSSQYCDVDSDCGNPKERCCSNIGTCHDKRGLNESCNFVVSDIDCHVTESIFCETFSRLIYIYIESSTRLRTSSLKKKVEERMMTSCLWKVTENI